MKTLHEIQEQLASSQFEFSHHAFVRTVERNISEQEIRQAGNKATIIEEYPDDKYSPSCLLIGFTEENRPIHVQVSLAETDVVKIITIYEPDENEWINFLKRRK